MSKQRIEDCYFEHNSTIFLRCWVRIKSICD